jgi:hypothetical protein
MSAGSARARERAASAVVAYLHQQDRHGQADAQIVAARSLYRKHAEAGQKEAAADDADEVDVHRRVDHLLESCPERDGQVGAGTGGGGEGGVTYGPGRKCFV